MKIIKKILKITIFLLISFSALISQTKRDPRSVALAGTYTTIADGIFSIGYNPSLLAYQQEKPFMLQLGGFDFGVVGKISARHNAANQNRVLRQSVREVLPQGGGPFQWR